MNLTRTALILYEPNQTFDSDITGVPDYVNMKEGRKRKKIANPRKWKRNKNKILRMKGKSSLGFTRSKDKLFKHTAERKEIGIKLHFETMRKIHQKKVQSVHRRYEKRNFQCILGQIKLTP